MKKFSSSYLLLPKRLILVRHGESAANVDPNVYSTTPDWRIQLTENGMQQSARCGKEVRDIIGDGKVYFYVSPYRRARQTLQLIQQSFNAEQILGICEDERIREQEMGNYQDADRMTAIRKERDDFSRFYYRFPGGENGADVADRVSSFLETLFRERQRLEGATSSTTTGVARPPQLSDTNVVVVCHGLFLRLFIGRWYKLPLEVFETLRNPPNCAIVVLQRDDEKRRLVMLDESKRHFGDDPMLQNVKFDGSENASWYEDHVLDIASIAASAQQSKYPNAHIPYGQEP